MRLLPLLFAVLSVSAGPLRASDDWLGLDAPRPLAKALELSVTVHQAQRETWARGNEFAWMTDADGVIKEQRLITGELGLRWQMTPSWGLSLVAPGVFIEMAPFAPAGSVLNFQPGDAALRRSQGLGDLRLGLRWQPAAQSGAWSTGFLVEGTAPTGLGPFEAPHPLAATGEGRWAATLAWLSAVRLGAWNLGLDLRGTYQFGREAVVPEGALLLYNGNLGSDSLPPGPSYLDGRTSLRGALGLGWDWHVTEDERQSVGVALVVGGQGPWSSDRAFLNNSSISVALQPELQARYGAFNALFGWQAPYLYAFGVPAPDWGELHARLDYAL